MALVAMPKDFISWMSYSPQAAAHTASKRKDRDAHTCWQHTRNWPLSDSFWSTAMDWIITIIHRVTYSTGEQYEDFLQGWNLRQLPAAWAARRRGWRLSTRMARHRSPPRSHHLGFPPVFMTMPFLFHPLWRIFKPKCTHSGTSINMCIQII